LANAAFIAWKLIVTSAIDAAAIPAIINTDNRIFSDKQSLEASYALHTKQLATP
jgi:hypothetical protein